MVANFRGLFLFLLLTLTGFGFLTSAFAAEFSADMVSQANGRVMEAKISVKGDKSRMEMPQMILIQRGDLKVSWMVMVEQGMYMEQAFDPKVLAQTDKDIVGEVERVPLGKEDVNGQNTDKFKVTYTYEGQTQSLLQWIGPKNIPVKVEAEDGSWSVEYRNIQTSGIADSLFEAPAGYRKLAVPAMGQMAE